MAVHLVTLNLTFDLYVKVTVSKMSPFHALYQPHSLHNLYWRQFTLEHISHIFILDPAEKFNMPAPAAIVQLT